MKTVFLTSCLLVMLASGCSAPSSAEMGNSPKRAFAARSQNTAGSQRPALTLPDARQMLSYPGAF